MRYNPLGFNLSSWLCFAFLFLNALPRTTAAVNILIALIAITALSLGYKKALAIDWRSPITISMIAFTGIALLSALLSPYWEESIKPIRRDLLPFLLVYVVLTCNKFEAAPKEQLAKAALWSLIASYIARVCLAIADWSSQGLQHDAYTIDRAAAPFVDFFAINSPLYLPLLITVLLYWRLRKRWQLLLVSCTITAYALIAIAGVRTAFLCAVLVGLYQVAPFLWKKKWIVLAFAITLSAVSFVAFKPQIEKNIPKYATIFQPDTYKQNFSLVERYSIWRSTVEMVSTRPLLGYGLGWKKLHDVAYKEGFYDRWQARHDWLDEWALRYYDATGYGGTNPHNAFVQILFETGGLGLIAYLAILISVGLSAYKARLPMSGDWLWPLVSASLLAFMIVNLMNGIWLTAGAMLGLTIVTELMRQARKKPKTFDPVS